MRLLPEVPVSVWPVSLDSPEKFRQNKKLNEGLPEAVWASGRPISANGMPLIVMASSLKLPLWVPPLLPNYVGPFQTALTTTVTLIRCLYRCMETTWVVLFQSTP